MVFCGYYLAIDVGFVVVWVAYDLIVAVVCLMILIERFDALT